MSNGYEKENLRKPDGGVSPKKSEVWKENIRQAFGVIRTHKMRSSLLILGVAIGVTAVIAMVAVMNGLGERVQSDIVSASRPYIAITRYDPIEGNRDPRELARRKKLTPEDARALKESCRSVEKVDFQVSPGSGMKVLRYEGERTNLIQVAGVSANFPFMFSLQVDEGRFFTEFELDTRRRVVVLGYGPAKDLFPNRDPIGKRVKIGNFEYKVVGTMAKRENIMGSISDNYAVIPYTTFNKDLSNRYDDYQIYVTIKPEYSLEEARDEIVAVMRARHRLEPSEENDFYVTTSETFREMLANVTRYIGLVLVVISSIGLMVGGIGVMNIMLVSVAERTREIGVRMALGARKKDILQQVLVESAALTGSGGILGIISGLLVAKGVTRLISFPFTFSVLWIIIALLFSAGIGIIFGIYPANRAANMDPIRALRYD